MVAAGSCRKSLHIYQTTRRHIQDAYLYSQWHDNVKSYTIKKISPENPQFWRFYLTKYGLFYDVDSTHFTAPYGKVITEWRNVR
jgi:hypothetical protein